MARLVNKKGHQKDMCNDEIGSCAPYIITNFRFNCEHKVGGPMRSLKRE